MATASSYTPKSYYQILALTISLPLAGVATTAAAQTVGSVTRDTNLGGRDGRSGGTVDRGGNNDQNSNDRARAEKEKAERERAEKARAEQAQAERDRAARERAEKERAEKARAEQAQAEKERAARERAEKERAEKARAEQAQAERDRAARERAEKERAEKARAEQAQAEKDRAARERAEKERAEKARAEQAQAEKDRAARERAEKARAEQAQAEKERAARERAEKERAEKERAEKERAEKEREDDSKEDEELDDLAIGRVTASGNGCAAGTWRATIDDTGRGFKVEFTDLTTEIKPTQAESVARCRLSIAVPPKSGGTSYRVGQFDYAGYTYLENGVKGEFVVDYVFAGDPSTAVNVTTELGGPLDREYSVTDHADGEALWSPCSKSNTLNIDVTIRLKNGATRADGVLEVTNATGLGFDMRACD